MNRMAGKYILALAMLMGCMSTFGKETEGRLVKVGDGYAASSVNTTVFRGS